jgi:capsular polysaccharide export protein
VKQFFVGFSHWGLNLIKHFFPEGNKFIVSSLEEALKLSINTDSVVYMYPAKEDLQIRKYCEENNIKVYLVEDGFIRSLSLGSSFFKPASIVIDSRGIYFDPRRESDLEYILNNYDFEESLLNRAENLMNLLLQNKISKYNHLPFKEIKVPKNKNIKLVIGQVDDDMSIKLGGYGLDSLSLLKLVKDNSNKDDYIIYKPHPDVVANIRKGKIDEKEIQNYCDLIVKEANLDSCFEVCNEVHTITSLSGLEALIRNKKVFTYGMPFYAGWGLTEDLRKCKRRKRNLNLKQLIAATYILYPKYRSILTLKKSFPEEILKEIKDMRDKYFNNIFFRFKINFLGKTAVTIRKIRDLI